MITVPGVKPATRPVPLMVAIAGLLLLHVPPGVGQLNGVVKYWHTPVGPTIGAGTGFTVIFIESRGPSQLPIFWLKKKVLTPAIEVLTVGGVADAVPPVAVGYHSTVPPGTTPVTVNGTNVCPWQYGLTAVTTGGGGTGAIVTCTKPVSLQ